MYNLKE